MGSVRRPPKLKETENNDENKKKCIFQRWEKIWDFDIDIQTTAAKILEMYTHIILKEFFAVKTSNEWDQKEFLDRLKRCYTLRNSASKWSTNDKLHRFLLM